jgi:hypothetical protein
MSIQAMMELKQVQFSVSGLYWYRHHWLELYVVILVHPCISGGVQGVISACAIYLRTRNHYAWGAKAIPRGPARGYRN